MAELVLRRDADSDDGVAVTVRGEIDMATAPQLRTLLDELIDELTETGSTRIVFDCRELEFLDSSGIGVFVAARKRMGDNAELVLDSPPPHVRKVLEITGVASYVTLR